MDKRLTEGKGLACQQDFSLPFKGWKLFLLFSREKGKR